MGILKKSPPEQAWLQRALRKLQGLLLLSPVLLAGILFLPFLWSFFLLHGGGDIPCGHHGGGFLGSSERRGWRLPNMRWKVSAWPEWAGAILTRSQAGRNSGRPSPALSSVIR